MYFRGPNLLSSSIQNMFRVFGNLMRSIKSCQPRGSYINQLHSKCEKSKLGRGTKSWNCCFSEIGFLISLSEENHFYFRKRLCTAWCNSFRLFIIYQKNQRETILEYRQQLLVIYRNFLSASVIHYFSRNLDYLSDFSFPETSSFLIFIVAFLYLDGLCVLNGIIEMKMLWQDLDGQNTLQALFNLLYALAQ